ncbi:hypothetical protein BsWGS_14724 [Bradybaena similaris]
MSHTSIINDYIAGALGGCAGIIAGHPLDTIKVQIQTQEYGGKYSGLMDCIRTVHSQNLSKGYFRGLSWPLFSYGYLNAIFFGSYGFLMKKLGHPEDTTQRPNYLIIWFSSAVATLPQLVFSCPVEVVKVTLQAQIPHTHDIPKTQMGKYYNGPIEAAINIVQKSGFRGIYRGLPTQIVRDTPANCVYMVLYAFFQFESQHWLPSIPSPIINFVGGGIAGVLSWLAIMPFDVVKSKLQADAEGRMYKGFWDCARRVYAAEGVRAFFLGMGPMAMRAFPVNAVTLMVYTESLQYLKKLERANDL